MKHINDLLLGQRPASSLIKKWLVTQYFNKVKRKMLSQLEKQQLRITSQTQEDQGDQLAVQPTLGTSLPHYCAQQLI